MNDTFIQAMTCPVCGARLTFEPVDPDIFVCCPISREHTEFMIDINSLCDLWNNNVLEQQEQHT